VHSGVTMAGHRDCVGIAQSCLQLQGFKLLAADAGWVNSAGLVERYGGEATGTAADANHGSATKEGGTIPLVGACVVAVAVLWWQWWQWLYCG
jgi:hypothetical protein